MTTQESQPVDLFSPIQLGKIALVNRIIMAPLTRNRAGEGSVPGDINVKYYRQRASAGLIITEASQVSAQGVGYPNTPGIYSKAQVDGWRAVTEAVHNEGGHIFIQLWHVGRISHPSMQPDGLLPVSASAIRPEGEAITYQGMQAYVEPHALETGEIPGIIEQYRSAAKNAKAAGFDGIEIHSANGYLLDQFLRDGSNHRTDSYGGSLENRSRLLMEVIQAVLETWDAGQVGVRISPENEFNDIRDSDPQTLFNYVATALGSFGLAYMHVLEGDMLGRTSTLDYQKVKQCFGGHYMANCGYTFDKASSALQQGRADLVAFGSLYIANPDLVERFRQQAPLNTPNPDTFYGGDEKGYTDYPFLE